MPSGSAQEPVPAVQSEVTAQAQADAEMRRLESQETASGRTADSDTTSSAQEPSLQTPPSTAGEQQALATPGAMQPTESASTQGSPPTASSNATDSARPQQGESAMTEEQKQSIALGGEDPTMTGTVTEQELKAANPMLAEHSVYYDFDKYEIKEQYAHIIEAHANFLVEHPTVKIFVEGNCDDRGSPEYNMVLGQRRAESVQKAMMVLGVSANQIEAVSFGAERPVAAGHDEASWGRNRRSDIVYPIRGK